jgi:uncharacterized protein (DUF58 family)
MRPTGRALGLLGVGLVVAAVPTVADEAGWWPVWVGWLGVVAIAMVVDFALLPLRRQLQVAVEAPAAMPIGGTGSLRLVGTATRRATVDLRLELLGPASPLPPVQLALSPAGPAAAEVALAPTRRGQLRLVAVHLRWRGPLGLWWAEAVQAESALVRVTADVHGVRQRVARLVQNRDFHAGLKPERFLGDGSDFDSLREFVVGMDRRAIDWKATARHREVLCREFRAERDHPVMLCLDTGRLMGEPLAGLPRLDHAIHAALQLAHVCLRTGDRVGCYAFAEAPSRCSLPQAGMPALAAIQQRLVTLEYGDGETNFTLAMTDLLQQLRRRTLVVLFTDFVDSVTAELMLRNVQWLARRHLLLFVALRDPLLGQLAAKPLDSIEDLHRAVVAEEIQRERRLVLERIRAAGALVLDAEAAELERGLVHQYLQVKRRELL